MKCRASGCPGTVRVTWTPRSGQHAACEACHCPVALEEVLTRMDAAQAERDSMDRLLTSECAVLHEFIQERKLGLGGENIFELVTEYATDLEAELSALYATLPDCDFGCGRRGTYRNDEAYACDEHVPVSPDWLETDWADLVRAREKESR